MLFLKPDSVCQVLLNIYVVCAVPSDLKKVLFKLNNE